MRVRLWSDLVLWINCDFNKTAEKMMLLKYLIILQIQHENEKENGTGVTNKNMDEEKREKL